MTYIPWKKSAALTLLGLAITLTSVRAEVGLYSGIAGQNGWLFYKTEYSDKSNIQAIDATLDLIARFNKVALANGITMLLVLPPLKMRIYSEFLPPTVKINQTMMDQADHALKILRANQVNVVDLNTPFSNNLNRNGALPLFLKLDTHWSPSGVLLSSEIIKSYMESTPALKKALDATPSTAYKLEVSKLKKTNNSHDLVMQLPANVQKGFASPEESLLFKVTRVQSRGASEHNTGIPLVGSSYSKPWGGFPDALSYALQRDIENFAHDAPHGGSFVAMKTFLSGDAFQVQRPKLLIWEMPERTLQSPFDGQSRYYQPNTEWLLQASALIQTTCKPSSVNGKIELLGLAANSSYQKTGGIVATSTLNTDFIEIQFNKAIGRLDYITARISTPDSKSITLEAIDSDAKMLQFKIDVAGDRAEHAFRLPLPINNKGYTKVRIFPGKTSGFSFQDLQVCKQPEDLLK